MSRDVSANIAFRQLHNGFELRVSSCGTPTLAWTKWYQYEAQAMNDAVALGLVKEPSITSTGKHDLLAKAELHDAAFIDAEKLERLGFIPFASRT
jgi:hypothetical protein